MATCRSLLTRAMRMLRVKGAGEAMSADEAEDALVVLQDLYYDLIDLGADLDDVLVSAAYTAGENERIFNTSESGVVITSPETIEDLSVTPDADGNQLRAPRDMSVISIAGSPRQTRVYDATLGTWTTIEDLALTGDAPWATQFGQGFVAMLAMLLADEYGVQAGKTTSDLATEARSRIMGRMRTSAGSVFFQPDRRWA